MGSCIQPCFLVGHDIEQNRGYWPMAINVSLGSFPDTSSFRRCPKSDAIRPAKLFPSLRTQADDIFAGHCFGGEGGPSQTSTACREPTPFSHVLFGLFGKHVHGPCIAGRRAAWPLRLRVWHATVAREDGLGVHSGIHAPSAPKCPRDTSMTLF